MLSDEDFEVIRAEFKMDCDRTNLFERPDSNPPLIPPILASNFSEETLEIIRVVSTHSSLTIQQITGPRKIPMFCRWRNLAMHIAYDYCKKEVYEISAAFGHRDPTTITHGVRRFKQLMDEEPQWKAKRDRVLSQLSGLQ